MNRWIGIGNLGRDPETKFLPSGQAVSNFSIAINEKWTNKDGEKVEKTEWVRIVVFGKQAESCGQYLAKAGPWPWRAGCKPASTTRTGRSTT